MTLRFLLETGTLNSVIDAIKIEDDDSTYTYLECYDFEVCVYLPEDKAWMLDKTVSRITPLSNGNFYICLK